MSLHLSRARQSRHGLPAILRRNLRLEILEARDLPSISFVKQPVDTSTGQIMQPVQVMSTAGPNVPVTLALNAMNTSGTPLLGGPVTVLPNATSGIATFSNLYIYGGTAKSIKDVPPCTFTAIAGSDVAVSSSFQVKAGGSQLNFATTITTTTAGANLGPLTVQILDSDGSIDTSATPTQLQLYIVNNAGTGQFVGTDGKALTTPITATTSKGVATFTDVRLDKAGIGYTLGVRAINRNDVVDPATSNRFTVGAGAPFGLGFLIQPTYTGAGERADGANQGINTYPNNDDHTWTGVVVDVVDQFDNRVPGGFTNGSVTLAPFDRNNKPVNFASGTATQPIDSNTGIASFPGLFIATEANGYYLKATGTLDGGRTMLKEKNSVPFNVGPVRGTALTFITPPPNNAAMRQNIQANLVEAMTGKGVSPIKVTFSNHGLRLGQTGQKVTIAGAKGNTAANGTWPVTVIDANTFSLDTTTGNGDYAGGASWSLTGVIQSANGAGNTPILITSPGHGLITGNTVIISDAAFANGAFVVEVVDTDRFRLLGTTRFGSVTRGTWTRDSSSIQVAVLGRDGKVLINDSTDRIYLDGGRFLGTRYATVRNGVATFSDIMITGTGLTGNANIDAQDMQFNYADVTRATTSAVKKVNVLAGPRYNLAFVNSDVGTNFTITAGTYIRDGRAPDATHPNGFPLEVVVLDQDNNIVTQDNSTIVSIGVLANEGRGPVFVGYNPTKAGSTTNDPGTGQFFDYQVSVPVKDGHATFPFLYMNQIGAKFIFAVGTTSFAKHAGATTTFDPNNNKPGFTVVAGAPAALKFATQVGDTGALTRFNDTLVQPIPGIKGVVVAAYDAVGNAVPTFSGEIQLHMFDKDGMKVDNLLQGEFKVTVGPGDQGYAIFDKAYPSINAGPQPPSAPAQQYQLSATTSSIAGEVFSNKFLITSPPGGFDGSKTPVLSIDNVVDQTSDKPFDVTVRVTGGLTPDAFDKQGAIDLELRDENGKPITDPRGPFLQYPTQQARLSPTNGVATFNVKIKLIEGTASAKYTIVALLDITAQKTLPTSKFTVSGGSGPPQGPFAGGSGTGSITTVGLANYTESFDYIYTNIYDKNPLYKGKFGTQHFPPVVNFDPAKLTDRPPMQQPNVAVGFDQVPVSTKWWSSLVFPRFHFTGPSEQPQDSQGNQLFPLYAEPFTAMVNGIKTQQSGTLDPTTNVIKGLQSTNLLSVGMTVTGTGLPANTVITSVRSKTEITVSNMPNPGGSGVTLTFTDFAGIGLSYLTNLFIPQVQPFSDPNSIPPGQPKVLADPRYPGAAAFEYPYGGNSNERLYQDFSVGLQGVQADGKVLRYSDSTITLDWAGKLQATLGEGLPFVYFTVPNPVPNVGTPIQLVTSPKNYPDQTPVSMMVIANGTPNLLNGTGPVQLEFRYTLPDARDNIIRTGDTTKDKLEVKLQDTTGLAAGMYVAGAGVDTGTTIASVDSPTQITLLKVASSSVPGSTLTFTPFRTFVHTYGVFLPSGVTWALSSNTNGTLTATIPSDKPYFSVATLPGPTTQTGNFVVGNPKVFMPQDTSLLFKGMTVTGPGIEPNTTIASVDNASQITLSAAPMAKGDGVALTFGSFDTTNVFKVFSDRAFNFVTGTTSSFSFDESTGTLVTTYSLQTQAKAGAAGGPLQALKVTQYNKLTADELGGLVADSTKHYLTYVSPHGLMKVWDGSAFRTQLQYTGVLPAVPPLADDGTSHADLWHNYLLPILQSVSSGSQGDGLYTLRNLLGVTNNYLEAQQMYGAAQLVPILLEISQSKDVDLSANDKAQAAVYAEQVYKQVKDRMGAWLSATDDDVQQMLYYQPPALQESKAPADSIGWQSLMSVEPGFLSSETLNDHQLIAGYFIKVATFLAQYDSKWSDSTINLPGKQSLTGKLGDIVNMMIGDVANYNRDSRKFPFLRNFDVWAGHSWADGAANDNAGTNLESSSEALNFDAALIQWGLVTGDRAMRDLGVYLYTTELESAKTYWFAAANKDDSPNNPTNPIPTGAIPQGYLNYTKPDGTVIPRRSVVTKLSSNGGTYLGFIGAPTSALAGIQILPLSGSAYYLGQDPNFVKTTYDFAIQGPTQPGFIPVSPPIYLSVLYPYYALSKAADALNLYKNNIDSINAVNPGNPIDNHAFNIHWIEVLKAYGTVDASVTADAISYTVFRDPQTGARTYVAYNPDAAPRDITFKVGDDVVLRMRNVAPRTMRVDRGATGGDGTAIASLATPDFSVKTPQNRFFFGSDSTGKPTMTFGKTGPGESAILIPANGSEVKFTIEHVTGSLQGPDARPYFELYFDAQSGRTAVPQVFVFIDFTQGGTTKTFGYPPSDLSTNAGYEDPTSFFRSPANKGPNVFTTYFPNLIDATVTVRIRINNGGTIPTKLRTNAAGEQGRLSFLDLPYNLTKVGTTSISQIDLGGPTLGAPAPEPGAPRFRSALIGGGQSGWTATLAGTTSTFTPTNAANQTLQITVDYRTGLLMNNRFALGDPGFTSPYDFGGGMTLAANSSSTVRILGAHGDNIILGSGRASLDSPASLLFANFVVGTTDGTGTLTIDDSVRDTGATYTVAGTSGALLFTTTENDPAAARLNVIVQDGVFGGGVSLTTGLAEDEVHAMVTRAGEKLALDTSGNAEAVNVGDGDVRSIRGTLVVSNTAPGGFTDLVIDNSHTTNATGTVTLSNTSITNLAPAPIEFDNSSIDELFVFGGTNSTVYNVTGTISSPVVLITGSDDDKVVIGNNGLINPGLYPGRLQVGGLGSNLELVIDNSHGAGANVTVTGDSVFGLTYPDSPIEYGGFAGVTLNLGASPNSLTMDRTNADGPGPQRVHVTSAGDLTVTGAATQGASLFIDSTAGNVTVSGPIATLGADVLITTPQAKSITVSQTIDTNPGRGGIVSVGSNVTPQPPNALFVAGGGDILLNPSNQAPAITSPASVSFVTGKASAFTITTTGFPIPAISLAGTLPNGLVFTDLGDGRALIQGSPQGTTPGPINLVVTASNGVNPNATQNLTLTIARAAKNSYVTAPDAGLPPRIRVFDFVGRVERFNFLAYDAAFTGGVRVAMADVNADGVVDIITGAGPGGGPHVKVFSGVDGLLLKSFMAYSIDFRGGIFVAGADINNDGLADIITGAGETGGPHVKVFSGQDGSELRSFFAYDSAFRGGVRVAAGDVNGDGILDLITGAGPGGGPHVQAFSGTDNSRLASFMAYETAFAGGVYVSAGDVNADGKAEIITGPGFGRAPQVRAFNTTGTVLADFGAFDPLFIGGVRVGSLDSNGDGRADYVVGAGPTGGPNVRVFDGFSQNVLDNFFAYDGSFRGGIFVG